MKEQKQKNDRLPNLFVGPLGEAQIRALKFVNGLSKVDSQLVIIEKMEAINEMIENTDMSEAEILLAEKLLDELALCFIDLSGETYGTFTEEEVH